MRTLVHLNDGWLYQPDFYEAYAAPEFDDAAFERVRLPHTNVELPYNNFDEEAFQFISCYRRRLTIGEEQRGKRTILHFEGVMAYARVYFNGQLICEHAGGYTPFTCELTDIIRYGEDNMLCVMADSTERKDIPPFGSVIDYLTYGGIYREVWMEHVEQTYVQNLRIKTVSAGDGWKIEAYAAIDNSSGRKGPLLMRFDLTGTDGPAAAYEQPAKLSGAAHQTVAAVFNAGKVAVWDLDSPALYTLTLRLLDDGAVIDEYSTRIGFREARFAPDGFYLNGRMVKLRGLNRHQSYPYVGYAMPKSAQYMDAEILKRELGVHIVRTSHYPQSRHFLNRCDELGLLVFEEIPGWQHIGEGPWTAAALKNVEEMIIRDWNHPSIVLWGVRINESQDDDTFYAEANALARRLDDTRQTGGVRNFEGSRLFEDVYTYNDFVHRGFNEALKDPAAVTKKPAPYLVTEHNGHMFPTKKFDCEQKRVEHALRHLRVLDRMYASPGIAGAIGWCMFDYNTHKDFGNGDKICYHGVLDMFRLPKEAAAAYASQQDERPVMEIASSMNRGEREASELSSVYVFTNCDSVRVYKNGEYIGVYLPDRARFAHLPHPPVVISDFIGGLMEKNEGFSRRDAERIKRVFFAIMRYGDKSLPPQYRLLMGLEMLRHKLSYKDAVDLYNRYIADWGSKSLTYTFEGYIGERLVLSCRKGPAASGALLVQPDKTVLTEEETYDVCRVVLRHVDTLGNPMIFSNEAVRLTIQGAGEIIGPKTLTLTGGSTAFWVKSAGRGEIKLTVASERFGKQELRLCSGGGCL